MAVERKRAEEERQRLEDQLLQAQKMEAIGTLAGGIAHDFNNILSAIIGFTELAMLKTPEDSKIRSHLKQVLSASNRAKDTIKQILAFSRKGDKEQKPIFLNEVVNEALKLLRSTLPSTIEIRSNVEKTKNPVLANSNQIHQLLMNLCTNAAYAMREKGGILEITLREIDFDPATINRRDLQPGLYNQLSVSDTGHGMTSEVRSRIFEPYFTTREHGEGTGMGLAVVHGIVKSHRGEIVVYSEPGKGTMFDIFLPITSMEKDAGPLIDKQSSIQHGNERILFVDDEYLLAEAGKQLLENLGYQVVNRTSSIEALEAFRSQPHNFDLVVTDQTMPNMTGVQLTVELKKIRPDIPIILCTGFSEKVNEKNFLAKGISSFLMKPLISDDLARIVRHVLDQKQG
jgi:nitrogen-specific signal transduction histidine kinase/ActR/RegA family two-component response regulator